MPSEKKTAFLLYGKKAKSPISAIRRKSGKRGNKQKHHQKSGNGANLPVYFSNSIRMNPVGLFRHDNLSMFKGISAATVNVYSTLEK
jgi:hypothetical protein